MNLKPRTVFRLQWHAKFSRWILIVDKNLITIGLAPTPKATAVTFIAGILRERYKTFGIRSQLVIHGKNGRIQSERTYPDTTPRRKG